MIPTNLTKLIQPVAKFSNMAKVFIVDNAPLILTIKGGVGIVTTSVLAAKATPKSIRQIEEAEKTKGSPLTKTEKFKTCWKNYIPAALEGGLSIASIAGSYYISAERQAALTATLLATEESLKKSETINSAYKKAIEENLTDKQKTKVEDAVEKNRIQRAIDSGDPIIDTGFGNTIFWDQYCGRLFKCSQDKLDKVAVEVSNDYFYDDEIPLNVFYDKLNLPECVLGIDNGIKKDCQTQDNVLYFVLDIMDGILLPDGTAVAAIKLNKPIVKFTRNW